MNSSPEILKAKEETETNRSKLHSALNEIEYKIDQLVDTIHALERFASKYPLTNAALFIALGFLVGSQLPKKD